MEKKIKQLWTDERDDRRVSLFILTEDDELTEYIGIKVVKIESDRGEDINIINIHSDDGGVTFKMQIPKPKII